MRVNMPEFSAEASLYETSVSYRAVGAVASPSAQVLPAFWPPPRPPGMSECDYMQYLCSMGDRLACERQAVMLCPAPDVWI
jgi:hypothetical protein